MNEYHNFVIFLSFLGVTVGVLTIYAIMMLPSIPRIFHSFDNSNYEGFQPLDFANDVSLDQLDGKLKRPPPAPPTGNNQQPQIQKNTNDTGIIKNAV